MTPQTETLANFLSAVDFTHFCTFTTRKPVSVGATRRIAENVARFVNAGRDSTMFWAAEKFDTNGGEAVVLRYPGDKGDKGVVRNVYRYHFHALLQTPHNAIEIFNWYYPRYGRCQIINNADPDMRHRASYYCAKYITKQLADFDIYFSDRLRNRAQITLPGLSGGEIF